LQGFWCLMPVQTEMGWVSRIVSETLCGNEDDHDKATWLQTAPLKAISGRKVYYVCLKSLVPPLFSILVTIYRDQCIETQKGIPGNCEIRQSKSKRSQVLQIPGTPAFVGRSGMHMRLGTSKIFQIFSRLQTGSC
jgi:hypothetical protein